MADSLDLDDLGIEFTTDGFSGSSVQNLSKTEINRINKEVHQLMGDLAKKETFDGQTDALASLLNQLIPVLFTETLAKTPNISRSIAANRAVGAIKTCFQILAKKKELELTDEINVSSPKFQLIFGWFLELVFDVISSHVKDELLVNLIFDTLAARLVSWEEKVQKQVKGLSGVALMNTPSPFMENFKKAKAAYEEKDNALENTLSREPLSTTHPESLPTISVNNLLSSNETSES